MRKALLALLGLSILGLTTACAPEVGSKRWCEQLDKKPKGDWSMNEAGDYTKHCLFNDDK